MALLVLLLLLVVLATRGGSAVPQGRGLLISGPQAKPRPTNETFRLHPPPRLNPVLGFGLSTSIALALLALLFAALGVLVVLVSLRWHRRRLEPGRNPTAGDGIGEMDTEAVRTLLQGTRSALLRLRQRVGGPPGDAVQQAWLELEAAAAECGTARRPEQTPTEFTGAVLADHAVDPDALATLRGLYQRARFGRADSVTEADADAAITALDRIAATLAAVR